LPEKKEETSVKTNNDYNINYTGNNTTTRNYINTNSNMNELSTRKESAQVRKTANIATRKESVQVRTTTTNRIILLSNVLPSQIYENIRSFIKQGKDKLIALITFFMDMKFDGLTTEDSIINEISSIILGVGKVLGDVFDDKIAKALLESGSEDHLMLLMHYAFPFIIAVIKLKIEKGIYKKSIHETQINLVQVLTQIERKIELDEQGNIKLSFRIHRQINESSLYGLLNP
jgi:hypothetical protein